MKADETTRDGEHASSRDAGGATAGSRVDLLIVAIPFACCLLLYAPLLTGLVENWWEDPDYSHGFLVPFVSGWLVWQRWSSRPRRSGDGYLGGLSLLLAGLALLILGDLAAEFFVSRVSFLVTLSGLLIIHLGWPVFRWLSLPMAYLAFMIPLPASLYYAATIPLQRFAATASAQVLDRLGVPVLLDGNIIHLPHLTLGVVEACSGIRSLVSLLALVVAWSHISLTSRTGRVVAVLAVLPAALLANIVRVVATALIARGFGVEYARGFYHEVSGMATFFLAALLVIGSAELLRRLRRRT